MAADLMMADESVPPSATAPVQSAAIAAREMRAAGIRVVPVMFGWVVVVVDDVDVSALTPPGAACDGGRDAGRAGDAEGDDDPDWQAARRSEAATATAATGARFICPFLSASPRP